MNNTESLYGMIPQASGGWTLSVVLCAVAIGVFLSLMVNMGPSFINLIQTSLHRGFRPAAWFALGVVCNDMMIISLCSLTSLPIDLSDPAHFRPFVFVAGAVIVAYGLVSFFRCERSEAATQLAAAAAERRTEAALERRQHTPSWAIFFGKGFLLNLLNPFVWIFWFSSVTIVSANLGGRQGATLIFFAIVMLSCLAVELLKARAAAAFQRFFNPHRLRLLNRLLGALLIAFGLYFILAKGVLV